MKTVFQYVYFIILPVVFIFIVGFLYRKIICNFESSSEESKFICEFAWKDGFILLCSYAMVKLISPLLGFDTRTRRILFTIGLYIIAYGIIAWPFMLASFFQPFLVHVFMHTIVFIILVEIFLPSYREVE